MLHKNLHNKIAPNPLAEAKLDHLLQHLWSLHSKKIDLSLDRLYGFLEKIGNPHLKLPPVIHAAGTNGKGSTLAALRALLESSGKTVHFYSSPHLVHPTERIYLAGDSISTEDMLTLLEECLEINNGLPITFFEITTAAAMLAMSRVPADYCLLETGMGGRLDATNVVPDPACTIITAIGYDHTEFLGNSLQQIAREKSGIMKPGVPCIIGIQSDEALKSGVLEVFHEISTGLSPNAPLVQYGANWSIDPVANGFIFSIHDCKFSLPQPNLQGDHQLRNTGAALATLHVIEPECFDPEKLSTALQDIHWPGRLQKLGMHPYCAMVADGWEIWLDGGHNEAAGRVLANQAEKWARDDGRPLDLVVAKVSRKDAAGFLRPLAPHARNITLTTIENEEEMHDPEKLAETARDLGFQNVTTAPAPDNAIGQISARYKDGPPARILICGSLYLAGDVLKTNVIPTEGL